MSWVCGDLHLENIGSYRAANGLTYFDINDFDEAQLAPCTVDLARLVTSLLVAAHDWRIPAKVTHSLAWRLIQAYKQRLLRGKPQSIERLTAEGALKRFLEQVDKRSPSALLNRYTQRHGRHRHLIRDGKRLLELNPTETQTVWPWLESWLAHYGDWRLRDLAFRVAGTSSLGLARYAALVQTPKGKYKLLDFKAVPAPAGAAYWVEWQPEWPNAATRVAILQERLQDVPPKYLQPLVSQGGSSLVMRSLQPQADRLNLELNVLPNVKRLGALLETVAQLLASAHLRSGGRQSSAITDELMSFASADGWDAELLEQAKQYAQRVGRDYKQFCNLDFSELLTQAGEVDAQVGDCVVLK